MIQAPTPGGTHKGPAPRPDLEAIEARASAATPGPWQWQWEDPENESVMPILCAPKAQVMDFGDNEQYYPTEGSGPSRVDGDFIAAARQDIPALVAYTRSLEAEVRKAHAHGFTCGLADALPLAISVGDGVAAEEERWNQFKAPERKETP